MWKAKTSRQEVQTMTKPETTNGEPIVHSHISDVLPEGHPLANEDVYCDHDNGACQVMLHASNNECMQTWFETTEGNFCTKHMIFNEVTARGIK